MIDGFIDRGGCEFVSEFGVLVPSRVVSRILGFPPEDFPAIKHWSDIGQRSAADPERYLDQAREAMLGFAGYIEESLAARQREIDAGQPARDDVLTALYLARIDGESLGRKELAQIVWLLMTAGYETTASLLSNAVYLFSEHRDQYRKLMRDPSLIDAAVEEVLRLEPPTVAVPRRAREDCEIDGFRIPAGSGLGWMTPTANRDAARWENPNAFDITRPMKELRRHMSFGYGIHACLGAHLGRLEAKIALRRLYARLPGFRVDATKANRRAGNQYTRGWGALWVIWSCDR